MAELCAEGIPPDDLNCDAMLTVGRTTCYYAWTVVTLPLAADGHGTCHLACPFCDLIVRADAPDTMPRGIAESTKNLYSWVGYPSIDTPDGPDYDCSVRCPNCGLPAG